MIDIMHVSSQGIRRYTFSLKFRSGHCKYWYDIALIVETSVLSIYKKIEKSQVKFVDYRLHEVFILSSSLSFLITRS